MDLLIPESGTTVWKPAVPLLRKQEVTCWQFLRACCALAAGLPLIALAVLESALGTRWEIPWESCYHHSLGQPLCSP
jgi:hypothetical protein